MALDSKSHKTSLHAFAGTIMSTNKEEEPIIPSPDIFQFTGTNGNASGSNVDPAADSDTTSTLATSSFRLPTPAECATHLELLEVFYVLHQRILISPEIDVSMDIAANRETKTGHNGDSKTFRDATLWTRRQDKWTKYIEFAVVRFLAWRKALAQMSGGEGSSSAPASSSPSASTTASPSAARSRAKAKARAGRGKGAEDPDLIDDGSTATVREPAAYLLPPIDVLMVWHAFLLNPRMFHEHCANEPIQRYRLPWAAIHRSIDSNDWSFNHAADAASQFERDVGVPPNLLDTFSNWTTIASKGDADASAGPASPRVLAASTSNKMMNPSMFRLDGRLFAVEHAANSTPANSPMRNYTALFQAADTTLAVELREAVIRQTSFVDKMNAHMWIRSPALEGTMKRAIERYDRFVEIMRLDPSIMVVPTLDVDLAWHTHQCTALQYARAMKERVGRFVNHDDSIVKDKLSDGFGHTRIQYRMRFGKEYRVCGCWDCEALMSELEGVKPGDQVDMAAIARRVDEQVSYYRAVEVARRRKAPLPLMK